MIESDRPAHMWSEIPEGHEVVAVQAGADWKVDSGHRCRYARQGHDACGKESAAALLRGSTHRYWWPYCPDHMYGRWVEGDRVMQWILRATDLAGT